MAYRISSLLAAATILAALTPAGAGGVVPVGPIVNGGFEIAPPEGAADALTGTPADACIGIGHQVYWGSDTLQADLENGDAMGAAGRVAADPAGEALFTAGYGSCIYSAQDGYDLVWLAPAEKARPNPLQWSFDVNQRSAYWDDYDGDGDRETRFPAGPGSHNMWQAYPNPQQAWTGNFDAFTFRVESGAVPTGALVAISLSATPLEDENADLGTGIDCTLNLRGALIQPDGTGAVRADPTLGQFASRNSFCAALKAQWDAGDAAAKRDALGRTRIVQVSFWSFNRGTSDVVVDDVEIVGGTTAAEEVVAGNHRLP